MSSCRMAGSIGIGWNAEMITQAQLESAARRQGIEHLHDVKVCRLETGGALTFVAREQTIDDHRHRAILDRLAAIETRLGVASPGAQSTDGAR